MKVLALTRYESLGASSRVRFYQFLPALEAAGIHVTAAPLLGNDYLRMLYSGQGRGAGPIIAAYGRRLKQLASARKYDLLWIEKELLPWLPASVETFLSRTGTRFVVDYDDATFHNYDENRRAAVRRLLGNKIDRVMQSASVVVVGNDYLGNRAKAAGAKRVETLPSVVESAKYNAAPKSSEFDDEIFTIGWMGIPSTAQYLGGISGALREVCAGGRARVLLVGAKDSGGYDFPVEVRNWSEETEARDVSDFDAGVMPLPDAPFERGKCGYKLIQYMASGRPVVATPVGVNAKIVESGVTGFLADTPQQWIDGLSQLRDNPEMRRRMGQAGRQKQEREYSLEIAAPRLIEILRGARE